jgi:hypothetical protein
MTVHTAVHKTVSAKEIEVKTDLPKVKVGMDPTPESMMVPRPDLAGLRLKAPNAAPIYLVDPDGFLRWIPDPVTYNNLFRDWNGVVISTDIPTIARGLDLTSGAVLALAAGSAPIYIVSNGHKRWITSPATMDKYYFSWNTVVQIPHVLVDFIPTGPSWS